MFGSSVQPPCISYQPQKTFMYKGLIFQNFQHFIEMKGGEGTKYILFKTRLSLGTHWLMRDKEGIEAALLQPHHLAAKEQRTGCSNSEELGDIL